MAPGQGGGRWRSTQRSGCGGPLRDAQLATESQLIAIDTNLLIYAHRSAVPEHQAAQVAIADALGPQVWPHYRVDIELRTYIALLTSKSLAGTPDVLVVSSPHEVERPVVPAPAVGTAPQVVEVPMPAEIHERYLVVYEVTTQEVVTVLEILSLANKLTHEG